MASDSELLEAWRGGDSAAGSQLFDRHFDALYRFFRHHAPDGSDDLVQRTLLACLEGRDRIRGQFVQYMYGAACLLLKREYARRAKDREIDFAISSAEDMAPSPSSMLHAHDRRTLLLAALRRIPLDSQIVLELRYTEGLTGVQIAEALAIPEPTVRSRLRRAKAYVHDALVKLEADPGLKRDALAEVEAWTHDDVSGDSGGDSDESGSTNPP